ncbi:thioredoxin fold domain-containing protein [Helicobacter sp. 13S00477-4]|uniref:SoxW family protein n=1 Tax=Helicobacter sp. 13S00477-4 TaxID=1905759 RepID=UPI000BA754E7|nr:thioredoxin fold domain-containing protein [Helicobacter sp. 13S00477-4]PAF52276.1 thiol:disulfide interchange protein [Helicobacter sp. 13S00477-4]
MRRTFLLLAILMITLIASIGISGCKSEDKIDSSVISTGTDIPEAVQKENENLDKKSYAGLEDVFNDTKVITPNGKYMMMVFGANGCPYCEKLKKDIKSTPTMKDYIKDHFTAYYINLSYSKMHDFKVGTKDDPKEVKVSTAQLGQMYDVRPTPTIVFSDTDGKTILEFPGYMPEKQFMAMLEFIGSGEWKKAKDQKELNKMLQDFVLKQSNS